MPVVFVHGVNVRDGDEYQCGVVSRDILFRRLVLERLRTRGLAFTDLEIANPYWGGVGVQFRWDHATLPAVHFLEAQGSDAQAEGVDLELAFAWHDLVEQAPGDAVESLGPTSSDPSAGPAVAPNLARFVETVVAAAAVPQALRADEEPPEVVGLRQALLLQAGDEVARRPQTAQELRARDEADVVPYLRKEVLKRYAELLQGCPEAAPPGQQAESPTDLEPLGFAWWDAVKDRAGELFDRLAGKPRRLTTTALLHWYRERANASLTRFCGDVFVYLQHRGSTAYPGPIPRIVLDALTQTPRRHTGEPLIVITHSMGGNILYDVLTHFAPGLAVDAWVSVASQVGLFEEMKLFHASNPALGKPERIGGLAPRVRHWLNIYDPVDPFAFLARPVFADVEDDVLFRTGAGDAQAHGAYFLRPSFYRLVHQWLNKVL
jgi:hypothetical protein